MSLDWRSICITWVECLLGCFFSFVVVFLAFSRSWVGMQIGVDCNSVQCVGPLKFAWTCPSWVCIMILKHKILLNIWSELLILPLLMLSFVVLVLIKLLCCVCEKQGLSVNDHSGLWCDMVGLLVTLVYRGNEMNPTFPECMLNGTSAMAVLNEYWLCTVNLEMLMLRTCVRKIFALKIYHRIEAPTKYFSTEFLSHYLTMLLKLSIIYSSTVEPPNSGRNWYDCFCPLNGGCPLFRGGQECIIVMGSSIGTSWSVRLMGGVRYSDCPLIEVSLYLYMIDQSIDESIYPSIHPFIHPSMYVSIDRSIHLLVSFCCALRVSFRTILLSECGGRSTAVWTTPKGMPDCYRIGEKLTWTVLMRSSVRHGFPFMSATLELLWLFKLGTNIQNQVQLTSN